MHVKNKLGANEWIKLFGRLSKEVASIKHVEDALRVITSCAIENLGDKDAWTRPNSLKPGEKKYSVAGIFLIAPDRRYNVLVANRGFPKEQRRLSIPINWNHPGQVVSNQKLWLLENVDEHDQFRQFLKTSKMGSSLYSPLFSHGEMFGQLVVAAQARWTYGKDDFSPILMLTSIAAMVWEAKEGLNWWQSEYPARDAWYADKEDL